MTGPDFVESATHTNRTGPRNTLEHASNRDAVFSIFYKTHTTQLMAFLIGQGASAADAADIAQESMAAAYRCWHDIKYPKAWTYRTASRNLIRALSAVREEPVPDLPEPDSPMRSPTAIEQREQDHDIARALVRLPGRQRQVMTWTLSGYTPAEIAEELSLTPGNVRACLYKARQALRHLLDNEETGL